MEYTTLFLDIGNFSVKIKFEEKTWEERSLIALLEKSNKVEVLQIGNEAADLIDRKPAKVRIINPFDIEKSTIEIAVKFLKSLFTKFAIDIKGKNLNLATSLYATESEENFLKSCAKKLGCSKVTFVNSLSANSIGAQLNHLGSKSTMIVDIGHKATQIGIFTFGEFVKSAHIPYAGNFIDIGLVKYMKDRYNIDKLPQITIAGIKHGFIDVIPSTDDIETYTLSNVNSFKSRKGVLRINRNEVREIARQLLSKIIVTIEEVLDDTTLIVRADIEENGIALTGGTSILKNLDVFISKSLNLPCFVVENPVLTSVEGLSRIESSD